MIKSRRMLFAGHIECMVEEKTAFRALVEKPEGTRPLGRLSHR
jgi:hypothetical protein